MDLDTALQQVAKQYRDEGYSVVPRPTPEQLPPFARTFGVELLATRSDANVLVRVKLDRADLAAEPGISEQAELTNAQPGWQFDVVIVNRTDPVQHELRNAKEPSREQLEQMLAEAQDATRQGAVLAGFLLAWAGLEAAMRRVARQGGVGGAIGTPASLLVREVYSSGYLPLEDFPRVDQARWRSTELGHGLASTMDAAEVEYLINVARRLLTPAA